MAQPVRRQDAIGNTAIRHPLSQTSPLLPRNAPACPHTVARRSLHSLQQSTSPPSQTSCALWRSVTSITARSSSLPKPARSSISRWLVDQGWPASPVSRRHSRAIHRLRHSRSLLACVCGFLSSQSVCALLLPWPPSARAWRPPQSRHARMPRRLCVQPQLARGASSVQCLQQP